MHTQFYLIDSPASIFSTTRSLQYSIILNTHEIIRFERKKISYPPSFGMCQVCSYILVNCIDILEKPSVVFMGKNIFWDYVQSCSKFCLSFAKFVQNLSKMESWDAVKKYRKCSIQIIQKLFNLFWSLKYVFFWPCDQTVKLHHRMTRIGFKNIFHDFILWGTWQ